jgi:glyoxylase-like metal-dependent hydrolase (beta-lactamase superfamily II)
MRLLTLGLLAVPLIARAQSTVAREYTFENIAPGVYAFVAREAFGSLVSGNSLVVIGDSAVLVVDSGHFPGLARRMIADIKSVTSRPVRYLVNTHWHPDHWVGNGEYRAAFPTIDIISTVFTRDEIRARGPSYLRTYADSAGMMRQVHAMIAGAERPELRAYWQATLEDVPSASTAWRGARLEVPNAMVDRRMSIDLGGRTVDVMFLGRGNTSGDLAVYVPAERILATGDLVVSPTPYAFGSYFGVWVTVLDSLLAM